MVEVGEASKKGRYGYQVGGNVLQGGVTGGTNFWIRDLGTFGSNVEEVGGRTYGFSEADNGKAGAVEGRREVGESQGGRSVGSGRNSVGNDLHRETTGYCVTVSGAADNF